MTERLRVLIAEDETIIRLDLRTMLERYGFDVCGEARDGEEAVELAFSERRLVARAVEAGVFAYVVKPFTVTELVPAMETAAARHEELLAARRELGRTPPGERPLDVVLIGRGEQRWPLRITRDLGREVEVSLLEDDPGGR